MAGIIIRPGWGRSEKKLDYARFWGEVMPSVVHAVERSFIEANMQNPTQAEVKDRVDFCKKLADELRLDFGWSKTRIKDSILDLLRKKLLGIPLNLEKESTRRSW